jgi:hypothetical protein
MQIILYRSKYVQNCIMYIAIFEIYSAIIKMFANVS